MKNFLKVLGIFIIGICGGIFADQVLWQYIGRGSLFNKYRLEQSPIYVTERKEVTIQENTALQNAVEKVEKVVIGVKTETDEEILEGSGLVLTSDGLIITLADLVPQDSISSFFVDGKSISFQVLKRDLEENLALIKLDKNNLSTAGFGDFGKIKLGQRVFLVGMLFEDDLIKKVANEGVVRRFDEDLIQTSISEGDVLNGSPLFNIEGSILGLNIVSDGKVNSIPIDKIKTFAGF